MNAVIAAIEAGHIGEEWTCEKGHLPVRCKLDKEGWPCADIVAARQKVAREYGRLRPARKVA